MFIFQQTSWFTTHSKFISSTSWVRTRISSKSSLRTSPTDRKMRLISMEWCKNYTRMSKDSRMWLWATTPVSPNLGSLSSPTNWSSGISQLMPTSLKPTISTICTMWDWPVKKSESNSKIRKKKVSVLMRRSSKTTMFLNSFKVTT